MIKDYLKFRNAIKKDINLDLEECYMLETLFDYYNISSKYAYPSYETLMADLKTKRKAKISKLLKSLVKKGYISITKVGKKNTYKLLKYLFLNDKSAPVDSDGNPPMDGQVHFTEVTKDETEITEAENEVIEITGFTQKQAGKVLAAAKEKIEHVAEAFNYAITKGADNIYSYTVWAVKNLDKLKVAAVKAVQVDTDRSYKPKTKFDNFEPREYDYDLLEKKLLGWV
jgi:SOS-response transcriptional repressor LexA